MRLFGRPVLRVGNARNLRCRLGGTRVKRRPGQPPAPMVETARRSCYKDGAAGAAFEEKIVRVATVERNTKETRISGRIDLDGTGIAAVSTGIGFLDHMLEQLARHSL